jgi:3-deoxy-7-phosphoheptulonate synthase
MRVVTEALSRPTSALVAEHADLVQVGLAQHAELRAAQGRRAHGRPVLLKRGMAATVDEWLLAGEYLLASTAPPG